MRAIGLYLSPPPGSSRSGGSPSSGAYHEEAIRLHCRMNGHRLIDIFTDSDADGLYAQVRESFSGPDGLPALVLIPDTSHISDDLETLVGRLLDLGSVGAEVRCFQSDLPDPLQNGLDRLSLKGRSAQSQRRIRDAILAKASRGEVLGRTPYGYWGRLDGELEVVEGEAAVVRRIFDAYAGPEPGDGSAGTGGVGLRKIAALLNGEGLRTRGGHPWTPVAVAGVLRNRAYVGTYTRYGVRISGRHEPLVSRKTFRRVQRILESRKPVRRSRSVEPYLLGGVARCALCGRGVFGLTRKRRWRRKDGTSVSRTYRYYECAGRSAPGGSDFADHPSWRAEDLENLVRSELSSLSDSGELVQGAGGSSGIVLASSRKSRIAATEREFMRAVRSVASGHGGIGDLSQPLRRLAVERASDGSEYAPSTVGSALLEAALGDDVHTGREAIGQLVEHVSVGLEGVEVYPRVEF